MKYNMTYKAQHPCKLQHSSLWEDGDLAWILDCKEGYTLDGSPIHRKAIKWQLRDLQPLRDIKRLRSQPFIWMWEDTRASCHYRYRGTWKHHIHRSWRQILSHILEPWRPRVTRLASVTLHKCYVVIDSRSLDVPRFLRNHTEKDPDTRDPHSAFPQWGVNGSKSEKAWPWTLPPHPRTGSTTQAPRGLLTPRSANHVVLCMYQYNPCLVDPIDSHSVQPCP